VKPHKVQVGGTYHAQFGREQARVVVTEALPGYNKGAPHHVYFAIRREDKDTPLKPVHSGCLYKIPKEPSAV
jgi:hypothetical protein